MDKAIKKTDEMRTQSIPKLITKYSLATFCALFFNELYNIIDTLFVSKGVGDNAMGGVSIIFPFMIIQGAVAQTVGSGSASIISRLLGKKEYEKAGNVTIHAMFTFYLTSVVITIAGFIFMNPLLRLFGATQETMPYAKEYFTIILIGNVFSTGFSSIIRAEGKMLYSLLIWLIPTAINVALDAVFIYTLDMGVRGAALATVICYFSSFVMSVIFFRFISVQKFRKVKIDFKAIIEIITTGIPMLVQLGSMSVLFMIINNVLSSTGGTQSVNTFAYVSKVITFATVPVNAIATAVSPIISYNYGAKIQGRIKKALNYSVVICEIYAVIAIIISLTIPDLFIKIFTTDITIISEGAYALKILAVALIGATVTIIIGTYFQAIGKKTKSLLTNSLILIFSMICIPLFSHCYGTYGIWFSVSVSCLLTGIVSLITYKKQTV